MASKGIKGITIEIGADTTGLDQALKKVNKTTESTATELKQVERMLKFDPSNTELLAQKQAILADQISNTSEKLKVLKTAQSQVQEQFDKGDIGADQYRAFQRELIKTESYLESLQDRAEKNIEIRAEADTSKLDEFTKSLDELSEKAEKTGEKMQSIGGTLTASVTAPIAAFGTTAIMSAGQFDNAAGQIQSALGVTAEEAERLEDVATSVWKQGFGESLDEVSSALIRVQQNMKEISSDEIEDVTRNALTLAKVFESDVNEVTRGANNLMVNFGLSSKDAFDLLAKGAQSGLNFSNELFDNVAEYSGLFANMGYTAEEYFDILARGSEAGVYNLDYLNDAMKEFQIRIKDGSDATSTAFADMTQETQDVWDAFYHGKATVKDVADAVIKDLQSMEDQTYAGMLGVTLFGTKWEDLESSAMYAMLGMEGGLESAKGAMDALAKAQEQTFGQRWESFTRTAAASLEPLGQVLLDLAEEFLPKVVAALEKMATWFSELSPDAKNLTLILGGIAAAAGPVIAGIGMLASGIGAISGVVSSMIPILSTAFTTLTGVFSTIVGAISVPVAGVVAAITALIAIGVLLWKNWEEISKWCKETWGAIKDYISETWESIKNTLIQTNDTINKALDDAWKWIEETISTVLDGIKNVVSDSWEWVKEKVSNITNNIKNVISTVWDSMKEKVSSVLNNIKTSVSTTWDNIKTLIGTTLSNIKNMIVTKFDEFKTNITNKMSEIKTKIQTKWNEAVSFLKSINLSSIGKEIINGLIKGISDKFNAVRTKIESLASSLPKWVKKILGIHSPSRVFMELGEWIGIGLADGIESTESLNKKIVKNLTDSILEIKEDSKNSLLKIDKELAKEIQEINEDSEEKILKIQQTAAKKKRKLTTEESKQIEKLRQEAADKVTKLEEQAVADRAKIATNEKKQIDEHYKGLLENIKAFVDNKKSLNQLSLLDEAELWQKSMLLFEEGTEHRIKAQREYRNAVESINKEIVSVNQNYQSQMQKINDDLVAQESVLTKAYEDELNKRAATLSGFANIFDAYEVKVEKTGIDLINNLRSQVVALNQWRYQFESLSKRGILSDALLDEISEMGVDALDELIELNKLTDIQLTEYSNLYEEKMRSAREQAEKELEGTKNGVAFAIAIMREKAEVEMSKLEDEWAEDIRALTEVTETELLTMEQIGKNAGQGLLNGLASMESSLKNKAKQIADNISKTIKDALQVKSPSRVMIGIGENVGEGLIIGMDDMLSKVSESSSRLSNALVSAQASMSSSSAKSQASQVTQQQIYHNQSIDMSGLIQAISALAQRPIQTTVSIDRQAVGHAVSDYQYKNASLHASMKGMSL